MSKGCTIFPKRYWTTFFCRSCAVIVNTENGYIYFDDGIYQPQGGGSFKPPVGTLTRLKRFVYTIKEYYDEFIFGSTIIQDVYRCDLYIVVTGNVTQ